MCCKKDMCTQSVLQQVMCVLPRKGVLVCEAGAAIAQQSFCCRNAIHIVLSLKLCNAKAY